MDGIGLQGLGGGPPASTPVGRRHRRYSRPHLTPSPACVGVARGVPHHRNL